MPQLSLKLRLTPLWPVIAAGAVAIALLAWLLPRLLASSIAEQLLDTARLIEAEVSDRAAGGDPASLQAWVAELAAGGDLRLTLIRADGTVIADSDVAADRVPRMDDHSTRPEVAAALADGSGWSVRTSDTTSRRYIYAARAAETAGGGTLVVRLAQPATRLAELRGRLLGALGLALLAALAVTAVISFWLDRRLFQPLDGLIAGAGELAAGRYDHRLPPPAEEGLARLADAMNRLAARVEEKIAAVRADRDHLRAILESMSEGVLVVDAHGRARFVNAAFRRLFGLTGDDPTGGFEGRTPREVTRQPELAAALQSALDGRPAEPRQIDVIGPERRSVALAADAQRTEAGGAIVTVRDTTELNRVSAMRRDFVANVSHELKTPLSAIRGYAETLRDGALDEPDTARRFTERILEQCRRLQALLDDLLTLSRLESVEAPFETRRIDLAACAARSAEAVSRAAEERGVKVTVEPPVGKVEMLGDLGSLERLFVNLLDNAVKYNRRGGRVTVRLAREGQGAVIEVSDTGIGIPAELQPRIFERFYRVDKGRARDEGGTGLGLAIVKHVAQRHGGSVEVESTPGKGSTFRVRLPGFIPGLAAKRAAAFG